jgi:hypothetical protein
MRKGRRISKHKVSQDLEIDLSKLNVHLSPPTKDRLIGHILKNPTKKDHIISYANLDDEDLLNRLIDLWEVNNDSKE